MPLLYLEARIESANRAAAELGRELHDAAGTPASGHVGRALLDLVLELQRATKELRFLRTTSSPGFGEAPSGKGGNAAWDESGPPGAPGPPPFAHPPIGPVDVRAPSAPEFAAYTTERYDATIAHLRARRGKLLGWTVAIAAVFGVALLVANLLAREPTPVLWLALLPLVWLIPVPFFVLAFRGTLRTLGMQRLELEARS